MKRDEQHVETLISYVTESMTDHLNVDNHSRQLINISTGLHAKDAIKESLLNAVDKRDDFFLIIPTTPPSPFESLIIVFFICSNVTPDSIERRTLLTNRKIPKRKEFL
jgi:hypothetical protein